MSNNQFVSKKIISLLDTSSNMFSDIGVFQKLYLRNVYQNLTLYLYKRKNLLNEYIQEVILIPKKEVVDFEKLFQNIENEYANIRNCKLVLVDCFHEYSTGDIKDVSIIKPDDFWDRLLSIKEYMYEFDKMYDDEKLSEHFIYNGMEQLIELENVRFDPNLKTGNAIEFLEEWINKPASKSNNILIIGERGSGKSWLIKQFVKEQNTRHSNNLWLNPPAIYINLKFYGKYILKAQGIRKSLAYYIYSEYGLKTVGEIYFLSAAIQNGQIVLLLDGLDEISQEFSLNDVVRHYLTITNYISSESKVIITTRSSRFPSLNTLYNYFVKNKLPEFEKFKSNVKYIRSSFSQQYFPIYDIYNLYKFDENNFKDLAIKNYKSDNLLSKEIKIRIESISTKKEMDSFISKQLSELANIPACAQQIINFIKDDIHSDLLLFELSVLYPLIILNLESDRSILEYAVKNKTHEDIEKRLFDLTDRLEILEHIAWHLLETGNQYFNPIMIGYSFLNIPIEIFEILVNDMRTQTVFSFYEETDDLRFRLQSLKNYFIARFLFTRLTNSKDEKERLNGIRYFGKHNFNREENQAVGEFLKMFFKQGMVKSWKMHEEEFDIDNYLISSGDYIINIDMEQFEEDLKKTINTEPVYSPWTKYLSDNLGSIFGNLEFSRKHKIINKWDNHLKMLEDEGVLVFDGKEKLSFVIAKKEITNKEFKLFLNTEENLNTEDNWIPYLIPYEHANNSFLKVSFRKAKGNEIHPLEWKAIHKRVKHSKHDNDKHFIYFTNDYHLFHWVSGEYEKYQEDHPLVWVSAFVVAIYCNWKTTKEFIKERNIKTNEDFKKSESEIDYYYEILLKNNELPILNSRNNVSCGYRMPTPKEWSYAARARDSNDNEYPWDKLINSTDKKDQEKGRLLKRYLTEEHTDTRSVMCSLPNALSIYGMIGNVREWTYDNENEDNKSLLGKIMGATGALGINTFSYNFEGNPLPLGNTNLDVGFRIAHSIDIK